MEEKQTQKNNYFSISYITSGLFVDIDPETKQRGRVLLFLFFISKTKEQANLDEAKQNSIRIVLGEEFKDNAFICMNDFEYPTWAGNFEDIAVKNNFFIVNKLLPEDFWDSSDDFKKVFMDKVVSSALSETTDAHTASANTLELDIALEFAIKKENAVYMEKIKDFEKVRIYGAL